MKQKFYITTPIYYASGEPHIGHAFATLFADTISRFQKSQNKDVFFVTGLDEHGSKIAEKAEAAGKTPQEFVDELAEKYKKLWVDLNINNDDFIRTTSERHKKGALKFIEKIIEAGDIYEGFYEGLYCIDCEKFYTEKELVNGFCPDHLKPPQKLKEKNYFFNLKKYLPAVKEKILNDEIKITPQSRKNEILGIVDSEIADFSITREKERVKWGIAFPKDESQLIYVWVDALSNYITVLDYPDGEKFEKFWPADVHVIGAEINKFHSIFWPGLLLSAGLLLPENIFVHGLFTVNGQKMSKTLGNVIDPLEMVKKFGADATRYLLLSQFPASEHGDIKESEFITKYNADLANGVGNLMERTFTMAVKYNGDFSGGGEVDGKIKEFISEAEKNYKARIEEFKLFEALQEVFSFIKNLDKYINDKKPWVLLAENKKSQELEEILSSLFAGTEKIIKWLNPFMPSKMEEAKVFLEKVKNKEVGENEKLGLFPRI
jgi:methionyl-tRNA synthetase